MFVIKRDGSIDTLKFDLITERLCELAEIEPKLTKVCVVKITQCVANGIIDRMTTTEIDELTINACSSLCSLDMQYELLAVRIGMSDLYKKTPATFTDMMDILINAPNSMIADWVSDYLLKHGEYINGLIKQSRDMQFEFLGFKTLTKSYLLIHKGEVIERPQHMWMRCAIEIGRDNLTMVKNCYDSLSLFEYTHATPTLYNSCLKKNQLSSCMLVSQCDDSIEGIYETFKQCSILGSQSAGIGVDFSSLRAKGSIISSTGRESKGVSSFLRVYDTNVTVIDQGGKRKMSIAAYLQTHHADFLDFLQLRANDNVSQNRAREIFYAIWHNELLFKRARNSEQWSFFCPKDTPLLLSTYGDEYEKHYCAYEMAGLARSTIPARDLLIIIAEMMMDTGIPYNMNKDACNKKSNLKNVAITNSSNLCCEILIPSGKINGENNIGVCTLASINLAAMVGEHGNKKEFNFWKLQKVAIDLVYNLNSVIDNQYYSLPECERSSKRYRPIGIGVQGLSDVFMMLGMPFESPEAALLNQHIAECIYYGALCGSMELAELHGSYSGWYGSPAQDGKLQPHLWEEYGSAKLQYKLDWDAISKEVQKRGLRNSLLVAYMPTASTSRIFGTYAGIDPIISNIIVRQTKAGNFTIINRYLVKDLEKLSLWSENMKDRIILANGSVQGIPEIPQDIKNIYKTAWEMKMKNIMNMADGRGRFICQTQSMNLFFSSPTVAVITSALMYSVSLGLKTMSYYTRSRAAVEPTKITISYDLEKKINNECESCMA